MIFSRPTSSDLDDVVDRLKWSWDHMERFRLALVDGIGYHWAVRPEVKTKTGGYVDFVVDEASPLPRHLKFVLGDCIHSLRASLDNLIYLFCPTERAEWLVCRSEDQWTRNQWKVRTLPDRVRDFLYDLQPFKQYPRDPEGTALAILDSLWNGDKHRSPHIVVGVPMESRVTARDGEPVQVFINTGPLELGSVVARVHVTTAKPHLMPYFSFDIAFDRLGPGRGIPAVHFLLAVHEVVGDIVEAARTFL